ncbi:MAG: hypothetical protein ACQKBW_04565 [Puniceicoccales bacterium]
MNRNPKFYSSLIFASLLPLLSAAEQFSLSPENWQSSSDAKLNTQDGLLRVKSLASSIWLVPSLRMDYADGDVVDIEYALRGGNLIVQANWFDPSGRFIETATLGKTTFSKTQAYFPVSPPANAQDASTYELKLWVEADMPSLTLKSLNIKRGVKNLPLLSEHDFEKSSEISISQSKDGSLHFKAQGNNSATAVSILTDRRFNLMDESMLDITVNDISPSSSFSLQAIYWSSTGTYLGHADILKDETNSLTKQVDISQLDPPADTTRYSFKIWLSGYHAEANVSIEKAR